MSSKARSVSEYQALRARVDEANSSIDKFQGRREEKKKQLKDILAKYGVDNVSGLTALRDEKIAQLETVAEEAECYVDTISQQLVELDALMVS